MSLEEEKIPQDLENEITTDYEEEQFDEEEISLSQGAATIKSADKFIDLAKGEVIDKDKLSFYDRMAAVAKSEGVILNKPKKNCRKCYGRGYTGLTMDNSPIPCTCLFKVKTPIEKINTYMSLYSFMPFKDQTKIRNKLELEMKQGKL